MAEIGRGIKAGLVGGVVYGGVITFLVTALYAFSGVAEIYLIHPLESNQAIVQFALLFFAIWIVGGMTFGAIYAASYKRLLGFSSVAKGIFLAIIIWVLIEIVANYLYIPVFSVALINIHGLIGQAWSITFNFFLAIVGGLMVGSLWDYFGLYGS